MNELVNIITTNAGNIIVVVVLGWVLGSLRGYRANGGKSIRARIVYYGSVAALFAFVFALFIDERSATGAFIAEEVHPAVPGFVFFVLAPFSGDLFDWLIKKAAIIDENGPVAFLRDIFGRNKGGNQ